MVIAAKRGRVPLPGSERKPVPGAKPTGKADPKERIEVVVSVRRRTPPSPETVKPDSNRVLSRAEFSETMGADPADLLTVERFACEHGLDIVESSINQRSVCLAGSVAAMEKAFSVALKTYRKGRLRYRGRTGAIFVPETLAPIVEGVFGLDNRPQLEPHYRVRDMSTSSAARPTAHKKGPAAKRSPAPKTAARSRLGPDPHPFTPAEVAALYDFPTDLNGTGQCIAILEFAGGYKTADLNAYFTKLGLQTPSVSAVSVLGAGNNPDGNPDGDDAEVMLDIEVAGVVAPGAKIVVYFAPKSSAGLLLALKKAVNDSLHNPCAISISWGNVEKSWSDAIQRTIDSTCEDAAAIGITVCCATGDYGSTGMDPPDTRANADFPSSSPHVLACGGTRLIVENGAIVSEAVWNTPPPDPRHGATGGGVSETFPPPAFQVAAGVPNSVNPGGGPGRGTPDVAGNADPATGYHIRVDGVNRVCGGTSAVAPLWAGLIALMNEFLAAQGKSVGFLTPKLYAAPISTQAFRDITKGNNGDYAAKKGWDACTGLGSPIGSKLLQLL